MIPVSSPAILLADDNIALRNVLVRAILQAGLKVVAVADGLEALVAFEADAAGDIGLLITDRAMPRLDGIGLIVKIRAVRPGLKILMISTEPPPAEFKQDASIDFMQKPFLPSELVARARTILA